MAQGETYSSAGKPVVAFESKPIAAGDYPLLLQEQGLEIKRSEEKGPDAIPYVNTRQEAQGTAAKEGAKNRLVFHPFYLSLEPGTDGVIMPERGGGIVQYLRANGKELGNCPVLTLVKSDGTKVKYLDPEYIVSLLQEMTDTVTQANVAVEAAKDRAGKLIPGAPGKNKVRNWLGADAVEETPKAPAPKTATNLPKKKAK